MAIEKREAEGHRKTTTYLARWKAGGKKFSRTFRSEREAREFLARVRRERRKHGVAFTGLDPSLLADIRRAAEGLPEGVSIADVVQEWKAARDWILPEMEIGLVQAAEMARRKWESVSHSVPVAQAVEELLAQKKAAGMSERWVSTLRYRLRRFAKDFGGRVIAGLSEEELAGWILSVAENDLTRRHYRTALGVLCRYAQGKRWLPALPALPKLRPPALARPEIYSPEEARKLLLAADEGTLPAVAVGLFAGLRTAETLRLRREDLDWSSGVIRVEAHITKTKRWRAIPIEPPLRSWLFPVVKTEGPIVRARGSADWHRKLRAVAAKAGLPWKVNGLRHSYGSYMLARLGDAYRVAELMGNSPGIVRSHYARLVTPADAEKFWGLERPGGQTTA